MEIERNFIVEVKFAGDESYRRNQMTFLNEESADNWGFNYLCSTGVAEDYRVVDARTNTVVLGGTDDE
jgi:hypothetical protein